MRQGEQEVKVWRAIAITLGILGALQGLEHVWLPLVDGNALSHVFAPRLISTRSAAAVSIGALGITPLVSGFVTVEVAAWLIPRWRSLRIAGPRQRALLDRASVIVSLVLAGFQGFSLGMYLESTSGAWCESELCDTILQPGWGFRCLVASTLTAATCVYWIAIQAISRWGIGAGFSVLVGWTSLKAVGNAVESALRAEEPFEHARSSYLVLLLALVGIITWLVLARLRPEQADKDTEPGHPIPELPMRGLPAGILPFVWASTALNLPLTLAQAFGMAPWPRALTEGALRTGIEILLVAVFSVVLAGWFYHVPDVAAVQARAAGVETSKELVAAVHRRVIAAVLIWVVVFSAIGVLVAWMTPPRYPAPAPVLIAPVVAVLLDLSAEWRARLRLREPVVVGTTHWVYVADIAVEKLQRAGIDTHARAVHHRTLLHFFGPYVPIEICVATEAADAARELVAPILSSPVSDRTRSRRLGRTRTAPTP